MEAPELSVYGEAKGEYTRQLCVFLVPSLEQYFLDLLEEAREKAPSPQKVLWQFQTFLQSIPDWNQDKVLRETEKIQSDTKCDYLEELLTAVFIAHTKVLSAIRLTTKQKKLQITIPKLDHFLHRVLSDSARSLWTNAFLFADTNSIDKQKNLRQVAGLLQEAVLQAIRGLLPVKSILREYLHEDEEEEQEEVEKEVKKSEEETLITQIPESVSEEVPESTPELTPESEKKEDNSEDIDEEKKIDSGDLHLETPLPEQTSESEQPPISEVVSNSEVVEQSKELETSKESGQPVTSEPEKQTIIIDTKPSVSFTQEHVFFDSDNLEANEIHDIPFAEAELKEDEEEEEEEENYVDEIKITDEILPMDSDQIDF